MYQNFILQVQHSKIPTMTIMHSLHYYVISRSKLCPKVRVVKKKNKTYIHILSCKAHMYHFFKRRKKLLQLCNNTYTYLNIWVFFDIHVYAHSHAHMSGCKCVHVFFFLTNIFLLHLSSLLDIIHVNVADFAMQHGVVVEKLISCKLSSQSH